jgi:hypothetical protein
MVRLASLALTLALGALLVVSSGNCSKSDPRPTDTAPPHSGARAPAEGGARPEGVARAGGAPGAATADDSFQLTAQQAAPTAAGGEAIARLVVQPGAGYKMNKEFPTKLTLEPPAGVTIDKTVFEPADAEHFSEKELAFAVKMSAPAAGEYTIPGTIKFAVCTDSTCDPKKQKVALVLKAQ